MMGDVRQFPRQPGAGDAVADEAAKLEMHSALPDLMVVLEGAVNDLRSSLTVLLHMPLEQWGPLQHKLSFITINAATKAGRMATEIADCLWCLVPEPLPDVKPPADPKDFFRPMD